MNKKSYNYIKNIIYRDIIDSCFHFRDEPLNENIIVNSEKENNKQTIITENGLNIIMNKFPEIKLINKKNLFKVIEDKKYINTIKNKKKLFINKKRQRIFSINKTPKKENYQIIKSKYSKENQNNITVEKNFVVNVLKDDTLNEIIKNNKECISTNSTETKDISTKKRKKKGLNEKELQMMYEQKFMDNINKEYPDKEYENDLKLCLKDKKIRFMKENFPIMFNKDKFYLYTIIPRRKRATKDNIIEPNDISNNNYNYFHEILYIDYELSYKIDELNRSNNLDWNQNEIGNEKFMLNSNIDKNKISKKNKIFKILKKKKTIKNLDKNNSEMINNKKIIDNNTNLIIEEKISSLPKKIWSLNKNKINIEKFFDDCIQIWPFNECCYVKEIALEFLMKNNYDISKCFDNINEFVYFMKKRANELDFPIINENIKTIKKYNLRKN